MNITAFGKYIDQPIILNKLDKKMPTLLILAGSVYGFTDTFMHSKKNENKTQKFLKNTIVITSTIMASLAGTRGLKIGNKKIFNGLMEITPLKDIQTRQTKAVEQYLSQKPTNNNEILQALNRVKEDNLSYKQTELLIKNLPDNKDKKDLFKIILPEKKSLNSKEIFSEIKRLSLLGFIPIVGGISGGILADRITHTNTKKSTANKVKEGIYQYLANIFLCNIGAGSSLFISEKLVKAKKIKPLTPNKKLGVILAGITATGIIGGSYIANCISKKIINPLFGENKKGLYNERKPEILDIALHTDDIATAGILSGFKWIEPALPFMYFISGYRAGIGYRNGNK